jgi:hypothetical protein
MKKIIIQGTGNRYHFLEKKSSVLLLHPASIVQKRSGYRQQDKKRGIDCEEKFVSLEYLMSLPAICYYCKEGVLFDYTICREKKQWSLDRMDNVQGHIMDNVVMSCLDCYLLNRRTPTSAYLQEKAMLHVIKHENTHSI